MKISEADIDNKEDLEREIQTRQKEMRRAMEKAKTKLHKNKRQILPQEILALIK